MMIRRDSKLKLVKKVGVLVLGAALVFTQTGMSALAAGVENHEKIESEVSLEDESDVMEETTVAVVGNAEDIETSTEESSEVDTVEAVETTQNSEDIQETFEMEKSCTGVTVHMSAPDGVFPEGAYFEVREVSTREEKDIDKAISEIRDSSEKVKASYNYDITIYDEDGNEIEPDTSFGQVSVTFSMDEVKDSNLQAKVYHIEGSGDELSAEELETSVSGDEITALTDGFSYYTVEFIYEGTLCYTLNGDDRVALSVILEACGIDANGEITDVESSDDTLFKGVKESDIWYICALKAFGTEESLTVTIDGKVYTIKVTDDTEQITYIVPVLGGVDEKTIGYYTVLETTDTDIDLVEGKFYVVKEDCRLSGKVTVNASVGQDEAAKLILCDGKTLTAEKGITVNSTNKLYIYAQSTDDSMGALEASADNQAGIGSRDNAAGTIVIYGGKIKATGGNFTAGIGGGNNGNGGTITINGGIVTAIGGYRAAGIGGGNNASSGEITINGGTVTATGGIQGAGIGSGYNGSIDSSNISINGGTVTATGGGNAAGIGGGHTAANPDITINGGTVTASGQNGGAGIGSGYDGAAASGEIVIAGGTVTANGSTGGAGIGGGRDASMGKIVINSGTVIANGSSTGDYNGGAGIGAGGNGVAGTDKTITINGGDITATGYGGGAGIGGGNGSNNIGEITITDGKITARGSNGAAGIGKGSGDGTVDVSTDPKFGNITPEDLAKGNLPKIADKKPSKKETSHEKEEDSSSDAPTVPSEPLLKNFRSGNAAGGNSIRGLCTFETQGPLCAAIFKTSTPMGFREAFSFNLNLDVTGKNAPNYGKKAGEIVLTIPKKYRKAGRVFAVMGMGRNGKVKIFYDSDTSDETFTSNINIEGYAFSLIYSTK